MITREKEPLNLEMPFGTLDGFITPTERFYVRCHFPIPEIDEQNWRLKVEGLVKRPLELSLQQLRQLPRHYITATIECAGNSRVFLAPKVKGVQWELGAVGNAQWSGVLLRDLLEEAEVRDSAREIVLEGADAGAIAELPRPAGKIHFARSLPLAKAIDDVLLAFAMNGEALTRSHGFPLRAVVPGWYGMASVKWLQRVIVIDQLFNGYYQSVDYAYWKQTSAGAILTPLREMQLKAQIARPENGERLKVGEKYMVEGAAWGGNAGIRNVELTTDGGNSWQEAKLKDEPLAHTWRRWEVQWQPGQVGNFILMARASDAKGNVQPMQRDANSGTYMIHHCLPIEVEVR